MTIPSETSSCFPNILILSPRLFSWNYYLISPSSPATRAMISKSAECETINIPERISLYPYHPPGRRRRKKVRRTCDVLLKA
jgi:hypothetical protein